MSIMMWMLYTAYLHARLYMRRNHMWRAVAFLAVLSFVILVLTYIATYVIPGAHSYALAPAVRAFADAGGRALAGAADQFLAASQSAPTPISTCSPGSMS